MTTAAAGVFAFWLWKETVPVLAAGILQNYGQFLAPTAALLAAASFFALGAILIDTRWLLYGAGGAAVGIPLLLSRASASAAALFGASALLVVFAGRRIRKDHVLSLGFSTSKILKAGLPLFFTASSIVVSLFYFQTLEDQNKAASAILPRPVTDLMIRVLSGPIRESTGLPEISPDQTIDELLTLSIRARLQSEGVSLDSDAEKGLTQLLAHQRDQLGKQYGVRLEGDEHLGEVLNRAIIARLQDLLGPYVEYLPAISALAFFFAFKAFTFPLYFLSVASTAGLIRLLRWVKIVTSRKQEIEVERLTL